MAGETSSVTRITFYVHETDADTELWICRLLDKIQRSGSTCFAWIPDAEKRSSLDRRLWTWSQGSFTAHETQSGAATDAPITLADQPPIGDERVTLMIWGDANAEPPAFFSSFERCLEIVAGPDSERTPPRSRYRFYRDRGYEMETHNITPAS